MSAIRVTPEQLLQVASQLTAGANEIESMLGQLSGQVSPLGADWAGQAQPRFMADWQQWQTSGRSLHSALADLAQLMRQAATAYTANEQSVARGFGG
jgi:WXG100 family type VII secretion target